MLAVYHSKFTGSVNHLPLIIERYHRNKQSLRESVRHDNLSDYCNSLRKTSKFFVNVQLAMEFPTTCAMQGTCSTAITSPLRSI